jgi:hypothetical protein
VPAEPYESLPGFAFASATSCFSVFAGTDGCTAIPVGTTVITAIGAKSRSGSYPTLGSATG